MKKNARSLLEEELTRIRRSDELFTDEGVFSPEYVPDSLPHRKEQVKELSRIFRDLFNPTRKGRVYFQNILCIGDVGTGKTSCAKRFGVELEQITQKLPHINLRYRHLNCRRNRTVFLVLVDLIRSLVPHFPNRGFSSDELLVMLHTLLSRTETTLVLALDEIDYLFRDGEINLLIEGLTQPQPEDEDWRSENIALILITRNKEFMFLLEPSIKSRMAQNVVKFPQYTKDQLFDILTERARHGLNEGVIPSSTLQSISDLAAESGDARFAIELLWRSGKKAFNESSSIILPEHVRIAYTSIRPVNKEQLLYLDPSTRNILYAIAVAFHNNPNANKISFLRIKTQYISLFSTQSQEVTDNELMIQVNKLRTIGMVKLFGKSERTSFSSNFQLSLELPALQLIDTLQELDSTSY